jgi:hypothetical protein
LVQGDERHLEPRSALPIEDRTRRHGEHLRSPEAAPQPERIQACAQKAARNHDDDKRGISSVGSASYAFLALAVPNDDQQAAYMGDFSAPPAVVALANNLVNSSDTNFYLSTVNATPCP